MLKTLACAVAALLLSAPAAPAGRLDAPTVVIVVRHAEKADVPGDDPPLSPEGVERAGLLADIAEQAGVEVVLTTQLVRTKQTARPFLERRPATPAREFQITRTNLDAHLKAVADEIRVRQKGKTVLVVGHNHTAPRLVNELAAGANFPALEEKREFDAVFFVIIPGSGPARAVKARYGKAGEPGR